jgi:hypothetical protein
MDLETQVARNTRLLHGEEDNGGGLKHRVRDIENWRIKMDRERIAHRALLVGILIGLGLNGIGIIAIIQSLAGL